MMIPSTKARIAILASSVLAGSIAGSVVGFRWNPEPPPAPPPGSRSSATSAPLEDPLSASSLETESTDVARVLSTAIEPSDSAEQDRVRSRRMRIQGSLSSLRDLPTAGARVALWSWDGEILDTTAVGKDGSFTLGFDPLPDQCAGVLVGTDEQGNGLVREAFFDSRGSTTAIGPYELEPVGRMRVVSPNGVFVDETIEAGPWPSFLAPYGSGSWPPIRRSSESEVAESRPRDVEFPFVFGSFWRVTVRKQHESSSTHVRVLQSTAGEIVEFDSEATVRPVTVAGHATLRLPDGSSLPAKRAMVEVAIGRVEGAGLRRVEADATGSFSLTLPLVGKAQIEVRAVHPSGTFLSMPWRTEVAAGVLQAETALPELWPTRALEIEAPSELQFSEKLVHYSAFDVTSGERVMTWRAGGPSTLTVACPADRAMRIVAHRQGSRPWFAELPPRAEPPLNWSRGASLRLYTSEHDLPSEVLLEARDERNELRWSERATWRLSATPGLRAIQLHGVPTGTVEIIARDARTVGENRIVRKAKVPVGDTASARLDL